MNQDLIKLVKKTYGLKIVSSSLQEGSYSKRVWEITTATNQKFILKLLSGYDEKDLLHFQAETYFCEFVNSNIAELKTLQYLKNTNGDMIQLFRPEFNDYFVIMEKHPIIHKPYLTSEEQINLGKLIASVHKKLKGFDHPGLWTTDWMRKVDNETEILLRREFPDLEFMKYKKFMKPLDYEGFGLELITIHGDWHQANMSFTNPPFLFDLDTLSRGSRVEELARTLTHWDDDLSKIKIFYDNLITGYEDLKDEEIALIPKLIMAQLYNKYGEFSGHKDLKNSQRIKNSIPIVRKLFKLI